MARINTPYDHFHVSNWRRMWSSSQPKRPKYTEILYDLDRRSKTLTPAEKEFAELLTLLIEDFEGKRYGLPLSNPLDVLRFLMDQHGLIQKDLVDAFGTPSIVSEVLSGRRDLNKDYSRRLSERFRVPPELFF